MEYLNIEYELSRYKVLTDLNSTNKSIVQLVKNDDNKIYIMKTLFNYNIEVYKLLRNIDCIHMPKIYEIYELDNKLIIIEEFINGSTLEEIANEKGILEEEEVIEYIRTLCVVMKIIHNINPPIIHRDIKPANIIIDNNGVLKLIDFDASRLYKVSENRDTKILGTEGYASPEQFGFDQTDCRSDIYSIGVMMNILTVGEHPREKKNQGRLKNIIEKCTQILANHRYKDIDELETVLSEASKGKNSEELGDLRVKEKKKSKGILKEVPGFRTKKPIKIALAILGYFFLAFGLFTAESGEKLTLNVFLENISMVISLLLIIFMFTDFKGVRRHIVLINSEVKSVRILGYCIYTFILLLLGGLMLSVL